MGRLYRGEFWPEARGSASLGGQRWEAIGPGRGGPERRCPDGRGKRALAAAQAHEYTRDYTRSEPTLPTSVHLPKPLLAAVDRKARALRVSRNALIVKALEREVAQRSEWPPGFFEKLGVEDDELKEAVDEMRSAIQAGRRSRKRPPRL